MFARHRLDITVGDYIKFTLKIKCLTFEKAMENMKMNTTCKLYVKAVFKIQKNYSKKNVLMQNKM